MKKLQKLTKKQKIIVTVLVFLIFVGLGFFLYRPRPLPVEEAQPSLPEIILSPVLRFFGKKPVVVSPTPIPPFFTPSSLRQIMRETLGYIETQFREDGFYNYLSHYDEQCEQKGEETVCPFEGKRMFQTTNAWAALAYLAGYRTLNEEKYLNLARRDIDKLISHCHDQPQECLWVLVQPAKLYELTQDPYYLNFLRTEGELLLTNSNPKPMLLDIEIRELAILFGITGDSRYLEEAKRRLKLSEEGFGQREVLYKVGEFSFPQKACWQTLAKIEIGKQTEDKTYLEEVKTFLSKANIIASFAQFPHPIEIQPCIETYFELAKASGKQESYQQGKSLLEKFIKTFWDGKDVRLIYGGGGTIFNPYPERLTYSERYVILTDSAYLAHLLGYLEEKE